LSPREQRKVAVRIVGELSYPQHATELVHDGGRERALLCESTPIDERMWPPSLGRPTMWSAAGHAGVGSSSLLLGHFRRPGPAGETVDTKVSATSAGSTAFHRVIPGRLPGDRHSA
jgi:hypothetical protein